MTDPDRDRLVDYHAGSHTELIEEADKVGAAGWTKTQHTQRIIPVERLAPEEDLDALAKKLVDEHFPEIRPGRGRTRFPRSACTTRSTARRYTCTPRT